MSEPRNDRRAFILKACAVMTGVVVGPAIIGTVVDASAQEMGHEMTMGRGGSDGYIMGASVKQHCGTCEFWGGPRRLSEDKKDLTITGLGWCNNPASPNYQKLTSPDHGPMDTWRKWSVLA
jgi:hypothetical protein